MKKKIMGERIYFKKLQENDLDNLFKLYSNENTAKYMRHGKHKDINEKILNTYLKDDNFAYVFISKETNDFIEYLSLTCMSEEAKLLPIHEIYCYITQANVGLCKVV